MLERVRRWLGLWRQADAREARNEQRKLRAGIANAVAIGGIVTGLIGPAINPTLIGELSILERAALVFFGVLAHLWASLLVRNVEDKS